MTDPAATAVSELGDEICLKGITPGSSSERACGELSRTTA